MQQYIGRRNLQGGTVIIYNQRRYLEIKMYLRWRLRSSVHEYINACIVYCKADLEDFKAID